MDDPVEKPAQPIEVSAAGWDDGKTPGSAVNKDDSQYCGLSHGPKTLHSARSRTFSSLSLAPRTVPVCSR